MKVVVVGSGVAGLTAALEAAREHDVTIVTKAELTESNTRYAQGGIAAVLSADDTVAAHVADTLEAGAGVADRAAAEVLCSEGPLRVRQLIALGVPFDRSDGELARGLEAAHSNARILHAGGDATGAAVENTLVAAVRRSRITVLQRRFMADIVRARQGVTGVTVIDADGRVETIGADAVILASGGAGQLYSHTTNPAIATGDGVAAALRAGATLRDLEFFQFHPTALALEGNFLISEAVRGEGAVLRDVDGERFMIALHPAAELAPRDVVARGIAARMVRQAGRPVFLDATVLGAAFLAERFPSITRECLKRGIDWSVTPVPVTPAAHYWMGGVRTDLHGRTDVPGLFAVGEVASTGAHGANRLASNSLLEALVFAHRAARAVALPWPEPRDISEFPREVSGPGGTVEVSRGELQALMWEHAGLVRDRAGLLAASSALASWRSTGTTVHDRETANLLEIARAVVAAALAREESRGAHFRSDFPNESDFPNDPLATSLPTDKVPLPC